MQSLTDKSKLIRFLNKYQQKATSPLNNQKYDPTEALDNLSFHLQQQLKSGSVDNVNKDDFYVNKDPYTTSNKIQFEEAFRADGIVRRALLRKADFVFAKGIKTVLDTMDDEFDTDYQKRQDALSGILSKQEYKDARVTIDKIHRKTNFRHFLRAGYLNSKIYGRSGILKEYTGAKSDTYPDYAPTSLYAMNSKLMGNVYCDRKSHVISYIEYNTNTADSYNSKVFYEPDDLIYFTNIDYHISPNTLGYGLSELEAIKDISETNRVIDEEDFKEIAFSMWAGVMIFSVPDIHNEGEIQTLLNDWHPGAPMAISSEIIATPLEIAHELNDLVEARTQFDKRILRNLGIPSFALGFETDANRATAQFVLHAWKESFVEQERIWIKDIVQQQWINPLWANALNMTEDEVQDLDAKLTLEFIEYNFDTFSENVGAWFPLVQAGYISVQDFLDKIGQPELAEKYKELKKSLVQQGFVPPMGAGQGKGIQGGSQTIGQETAIPNESQASNKGGKGTGGQDSSALGASEIKKAELKAAAEVKALEQAEKIKQAQLELETEQKTTELEKERRKEIDRQIKETAITNKRLELLESIKKKTEELSK